MRPQAGACSKGWVHGPRFSQWCTSIPHAGPRKKEGHRYDSMHKRILHPFVERYSSRDRRIRTHMDLLIDADILACQFAYAYEASRSRTADYDDDGDVDIDDAGWAVEGFDSAVERMIGQTGTKDALLCFTGRSNFRYSILPTYKASRRGKPKPVLLDALIEHARASWTCREVDCLEADDVMGIMATKSPGRYVMATIDKDLKQIPGIHYDWRKERIKAIEPREADYWFYFQVLTGDSTDGYAGCPGIGVARARKVLKGVSKDGIRDCTRDRVGGGIKGGMEAGTGDGSKGITKGVTDHSWARVVRAFESRGLTEEDALVQARVARILRVDDYDFAERQPILWSPDSTCGCSQPT